jgi:probable phosphoglycerate mutase
MRHGESQAQIDRIVSGHDTCTGLSERGWRQAELLGERLSRSGELRAASGLYSSILPRAIETASVISAAVGGHDVRSDCSWCEIHPGEAEGIAWEEFSQRYGNEGAFGRAESRVPGSESTNAFVARVEAAIVGLVDAHEGETVVVVAHGGVVQCALEALVGIEFGTMIGYVENTSITEFRQSSGGEWRLSRLNDHAHLWESTPPLIATS